ncbi:MAG TPA: response regulator [Chloroflexia bacterium]|jgi:CheY-like chemotaxis protein|nr:response regulator [Chloroflexia bacterium]
MKTILIVEDELILTEVLSAVLEDVGYRVVTVADGRAGLAALPTAQPDLVLCDVMMPLMDGREMCRRMQADPAYRDVPVVLMTAAPSMVSVTDCKYAALIRKPFDLDRLLDVINALAGL